MLEGKVTNILNDRELVINLGKEKGVVESSVFEALGQVQEVRDPDTKEKLGEVEPGRIKVKVFEVHDKFCIARTFETYLAELGDPINPLFNSIMASLTIGGARRVRRVKKLLQPTTTSGYPRFAEEGAYVKVGDKVREIHYSETE